MHTISLYISQFVCFQESGIVMDALKPGLLFLLPTASSNAICLTDAFSCYDLFMSADMEKYRDFDKFKKCNKCELRGFCRGCPAVAYGYTGNMYAPDPQCWKIIENDLEV